MASNFDFTDKTQQSLAAAIQLAKDYQNAQGLNSFLISLLSTNPFLPVHPVHIASVLLNESSTEAGMPGGSSGSSSLFESVIQKAGGDSVSSLSAQDLCILTDSLFSRLL